MRELNSGMVDMSRRTMLEAGGLLGILTVLGLMPASVWAAVDRKAFEAKTLGEALDALGGLVTANSPLITLTVPEIAENGAVVPVTVESKLPHTEQIAILVDKNPTALSANFTFPEGTEGFVTTRIKMAQTSSVVVLVKADGKFYRASQEVKVIAGGC